MRLQAEEPRTDDASVPTSREVSNAGDAASPQEGNGSSTKNAQSKAENRLAGSAMVLVYALGDPCNGPRLDGTARGVHYASLLSEGFWTAYRAAE